MGHGASVGIPRPSPQTIATLRSASTTALSHAKRAALLASVYLASATQQAERWYAVADERVLRKVHNAVETYVLTRVRRLADEAEVASKLWFVKSISATSIADAFGIDIQDVSQVQIAKRQYEVYNCGPELLNVPTLNKAAAHVLELRDPQITEFLLRKCLWTTWKPPASWRMKVDQVFDVTVHVNMRRDGFLTGDTRVIKMRVGKKWVGPHHHNSECHVPFEVKSQWLHRVDYEIEDKTHPKNIESAFYQTVTLVWANYMDELSKLPKEDLRSSEEAGNGFPYEEQDRPTHLRIKYLLATSLEKILNEKSTLFRVSSQFELWCMAQEDSERHRMDAAVMSEDHFAGPLLDAHIEELVELFEVQAMEMEDVKILELMLPVATRPEEEQDGDKGQPSDSHSEATGDNDRVKEWAFVLAFHELALWTAIAIGVTALWELVEQHHDLLEIVFLSGSAQLHVRDFVAPKLRRLSCSFCFLLLLLLRHLECDSSLEKRRELGDAVVHAERVHESVLNLLGESPATLFLLLLLRPEVRQAQLLVHGDAPG